MKLTSLNQFLTLCCTSPRFPATLRIDEKTVRRAGLDYWEHLDLEVADHWDDLLQRLGQAGKTRFWYFSRFATKSYTSIEFERNDTFVFGAETSGLPKSITQPNQDQLLRVPTTEYVRSLNLATTVGVASFEAVRQLGLS